jgi:hypothetical protein
MPCSVHKKPGETDFTPVSELPTKLALSVDYQSGKREED